MANKTKITTKKNSTTKKRHSADVDPLTGEKMTQFKKGDWLVLPLGILAISSLLVIWPSIPGIVSGSREWVFYEALLGALLALFFSVLYIYKTIKRIPRHIIAKVVAYTLSFLMIVTVGWMAVRHSGPCTGFFGVRESCLDSDLTLIAILFLNPLSLLVLGLLALTGSISLLAGRPGIKKPRP